jgi:hypothetical protein
MPDLIVPWRPDGAHRDAIWSRLKPRHIAAGRAVIEGTCEGEWCKAAAIADALHRSTADIVILHDADVWCDGLEPAVEAIDTYCAWAIPHDKVHRLAEGQEPGGNLIQNPYTGWAGGGIVVIRRDIYDRCPIDHRFVGWGQEDESLARALTLLYGAPWRGSADLWHWWHPAQPRINRATGSKASAALAHRYRKASTRNAMQALIEEGRTWEPPSSETAPASPKSSSPAA